MLNKAYAMLSMRYGSSAKTACRLRVILSLLLIFFCFLASPASASSDIDRLRSILDNECTKLDKERLYIKIRYGFSDLFAKGADKEFFRIVEGVIKRTDFDGISEDRTYAIIRLVYEARRKGAPLEQLDQIFDVAYFKDVTYDELSAAAFALKEFVDSDVPQDIYEEFVYHSMEERWEPSAVPVLARGLIYGVDHGLTPKKLALAMIVDADQGAIKTKGADRLVSEAVGLVRRLEPGKWREEGIKAYLKKEEAERVGRLRLEAEALKRRQVEIERMAEEQRRAKRADDEMKAAVAMEKLKRMDADIQRQYRAALEQIDRLSMTGTEEEHRRKRAEREDRRKKELESMEKNIAEAGRSGGLDIRQLYSAVERYLGIPYRYGGDSEAGIDCSAFTRRVYRDVGVDLPRTASSQARVGTEVAFDGGLYSGDLVFFDTSIMGDINHVGVYLDDSTFAHASKSRGVVKSSLKERYYMKRYVKGTRIFGR